MQPDGLAHPVLLVVALGPVTANSVSEDVPCVVEVYRRDRIRHFGKILQARLGILVPKVESAVGASSGKCAEAMKDDGVDSIDVLSVAITVTLECEVQVFVCVGNVVDLNSALDRTNRVALVVAEECHGSDLVSQGRLVRINGRGWVTQVENVDVAIRTSNYRYLIAHVHCVDALAQLHSARRRSACQLILGPEFEGLVPRRCTNHVEGRNIVYRLDRLIMLRKLHGLVTLQIPSLPLFVRRSCVDLGPVAVPACRQHRLLGAKQ